MADFSNALFTETDSTLLLPVPDDVLAYRDANPPTIVSFTPVPGSEITSSASISFDVLEDRVLSLVCVVAAHGNRYDVVFDGQTFVGDYALSSAESLTAGRRFTVRNTWRAAPTLGIVAVDSGGNVVTVHAPYSLSASAPPASTSDQPPPRLVYQPDHAGEADARLLKQFDSAANVHAMLRAHILPLQSLELAAFALLGAFDLENAAGHQLDIIGELVGEARQARSDVAYRAYIKARILANASDGMPATIYAIARALLGAAPALRLYRDEEPAHYNLSVTASVLHFPWDEDDEAAPDVVGRALFDALELATKGGVSFTVYYQFSDHVFQFANSDAEESDALRGFADADDASGIGGTFVGAEGL